MLIYDLFPQRSLVRYLRARGFELYMVDWGAGKYHNHPSLSSFCRPAQDVVQVRQHSGQQQLSLHGWSFGGLFSLCYTAWAMIRISQSVLVGTPVLIVMAHWAPSTAPEPPWRIRSNTGCAFMTCRAPASLLAG